MEDENLDSYPERPVAGMASGCLYAIYVVGLSAGMLFLNALFCLAAYAVLPKPQDAQLASSLGQMFFFAVPLIMLIVEWHLLDRLRRLF